MRKRNPEANIAAIDFDPGASNVNQLNRIKLMMATAYKNLEKEDSKVYTDKACITCIVTDADITKTEANRTAQLAHNGYARTISPVHTSADGDAIFVMATGKVKVNADALGALA